MSERLSFSNEEFSTFVGLEGVDVDIVFLDAGGAAIELLESLPRLAATPTKASRTTTSARPTSVSKCPTSGRYTTT